MSFGGSAVSGRISLILIDTSSWIHLLRPDGDPAVRSRVEVALRAGDACWCPIVQLELWNGARGGPEQRALRRFAAVLPVLLIDAEVWSAAYNLARRARMRGVTVPAADIVIAACAHCHGAALESADTDFERLGNLLTRTDGS